MYSDETQKRVMQRMEELGKLDDRKHLRAVYLNGRLSAEQSACLTCKARLQKERVYLWDGCADCFLAAADSLSGREIAEMTGDVPLPDGLRKYRARRHPGGRLLGGDERNEFWRER